MASTASVSRMINNCGSIVNAVKQVVVKAFRHQYGQVKLLADTTVNASTTLVTEGEFNFQVTKGKAYHVVGNFMISTGATPGIKLQLTAPALTTSATTFVGKARATQGTANVAGVTLDYTKLNASLYASAVAYSSISVDAILIPEADDTITVQFAQNVSDSSDSSLLRGSSMKVVEIRNTGAAPTSL